MSAARSGSIIIKTEYDRCDVVLNKVQCVQFDIRDVVEMVDEMAVKGIAGNALLIPPLRLRQLCDLVGGSGSNSAISAGASASSTASGNGGGSHWRHNSAASVAFRSMAADAGNKSNNSMSSGKNEHDSTTSISSLAFIDSKTTGALSGSTGGAGIKAPAAGRHLNTFAQAIWDKAVHMYRLLRHLGKPLHTAPIVDYMPGELLQKMDAFNTELELLLLRSRSGSKTGGGMQGGVGDDELCHQFVRGACPRGASCSFAHSKIAVQRWAQQWTCRRLRDYTHFRHLLQKGGAAGSSGAYSTSMMMPLSDETVPTASSASTAPPASLKYKTAHPFTSGSMLRFSEALGPETLSIVLDMLQTRDQYSPEILADNGREGRLQSIVIRHALTKPPFDVLCSMMELCLFKELAALDLGKCALADGVGRHRIGKLGKATRRFFNEKGKILRAGNNNSGDIAVKSNSSTNRIVISLGNNGITNAMASGFLASFEAAGSPPNKAAMATVTASLTGITLASSPSSGTSPASAAHNTSTIAAAAAVGGLGINSSSAGGAPASPASASGLAGTATPGAGGGSPQGSPRLGALVPPSPHHGAAATFAAAANAVSFSGVGTVADLSLLSGVWYLAPSGTALLSPASANLAHGHHNNNHSNNNTAHHHNSGSGAFVLDAAAAASATTAGTTQLNPIVFATQLAMPTSTVHPLIALNLEFNAIGPSIPDFADFIASLHDALPFIEKLSLAGNPLLHDGASRMFNGWRYSCVRYLNLSGCALGDRGVVALCDNIGKAPANFPLRCLNLGWNGISVDGATALGELLRSKAAALQSLGLSYNPGLGRRGAILISQALKENNTLRKLDVRWCHVQDEGCLALLDALGHSRNTSLAVLQVDRHDVDTRTLELLEEKLGAAGEACRDEIDVLQIDSVW